MRPPSPALLLFTLLSLSPTATIAQEPETPPPPAQQPEAEATAPAATAPLVAIRAGHVHPIARPELSPGIILVRGERIVAVGTPDEVEVPADAQRIAYPDSHVYPGLVDAATDAFTDDQLRADGSLDAGADIAPGLDNRGDREDQLVRTGVTTAFVAARRGAPWSGIAAIVRPRRDGAEPMAGHEQAAVVLQLAAADSGTHALQRQERIDTAFAAFAGLDEYQKQFDEHQKALEKYQKDFADYLAFHEKKNAGSGDAGAKAGAAPAAAGGESPRADGGGDDARAAGPRSGRGRRGGPGGPGGTGGEERPTPAGGAGPPANAGAPQDAKPAEPKPEPKTSDKPPERPKYPKAPSRDPAKEALLAVLDGKLPLRVLATRPDEIRAVLAAGKQRAVPTLVFEGVLGGAGLAPDLAAAAVPCVLTDVWPAPLPEAFADHAPLTLPARLHAAGVPFAIASGEGRRAHALPLMAACAVGHGLPADAALRAITLWPAEILGVQRDVGSLQAGRLADLLVCDRPLLQSDCRVLAVWSAGEVQFEEAR